MHCTCIQSILYNSSKLIFLSLFTQLIVVICLKHFSLFTCSMDGADLCFEIVKRADAGFVYSEAVARYVL